MRLARAHCVPMTRLQIVSEFTMQEASGSGTDGSAAGLGAGRDGVLASGQATADPPAAAARSRCGAASLHGEGTCAKIATVALPLICTCSAHRAGDLRVSVASLAPSQPQHVLLHLSGTALHHLDPRHPLEVRWIMQARERQSRSHPTASLTWSEDKCSQLAGALVR